MISVCLTYFKSLALANLRASLYSLWRQDLSRVNSIVVFDNDTPDEARLIDDAIAELKWPVPVDLISIKHGDSTRTHAWSTNRVVEASEGPWIFFTRADYLLTFDALTKFAAVIDAREPGWDGFVTSYGCHMQDYIETVEQTNWRAIGPGHLQGKHYDYSYVDAGVWLLPRASFLLAGGLEERLSAWGHAQTEFQHRLYLRGTEFVCVDETLHYHHKHEAERDIDAAHRQLESLGVSPTDMWARYHGEKPYR